MFLFDGKTFHDSRARRILVFIYSGNARVSAVSSSVFLLIWFLLMRPLYIFFNKIVNIEAAVAVLKEGKSDGWILPSSSSSGGKCEDAALP